MCQRHAAAAEFAIPQGELDKSTHGTEPPELEVAGGVEFDPLLLCVPVALLVRRENVSQYVVVKPRQ